MSNPVGITAMQLVKEVLRARGFDGLYAPGACACLLGDLAPCEGIHSDCRAGYKHVHSVSGNYVVSGQRESLSDEAIDKILEGL